MICAVAAADSAVTVAPYVQDLRDTGFTVMLETAQPSTVEVQAGAQRATSQGTHHELLLSGLPARSSVRYQVSVDGKAAGGGEVTLPDAARPLTFVVFGDTRDGGVAVPRLAELAHQIHPLLILHTGDVAISGDDVQAWLEVFRQEAPLLADVPVYPALGNHEIWKDPTAQTFARFFVLPDSGRSRHYYSFRMGPARFVVLDGNSPDATKTKWLAATLAAAAAEAVPHVFVLVHQAPFSLGDHCGAAVAESDWVELFEQYRVRAVFAGHDHAYERMERKGVRYFVSGGGGAPLYSEHDCTPLDRAARRVYRSEHHLLRVLVTGPTVEVTALPVDGEAPPLDVVRFSAGEPQFAMEAAALRAPAGWGGWPRPWAWAAGGGLAMLGAILFRRRAR
jgi:hypothetical protein